MSHDWEKEAGHKPVLVGPIMRLLAPAEGMVCLDCTVGRAGHARLLAQCLGPTGRLIGLDVDPENLAFARERLAQAPCRVDLVHRNFAAAPQVLEELGVEGVDLLLADLGFASNQSDDAERGLSFRQDGPLDMRLDPGLKTTAADLVNQMNATELANLIFTYGEERHSRRIAKKIVEERDKSPIETTLELARIVHACCGRGRGRGGAVKIDSATRTFMALRIAVNGELDALDRLLDGLMTILKPHAKAALISFHSLEDRRVKQCFTRLSHQGLALRLTRKPIMADESERIGNPRSRSAKLRVLQRGVDSPDHAACSGKPIA